MPKTTRTNCALLRKPVSPRIENGVGLARHHYMSVSNRAFGATPPVHVFFLNFVVDVVRPGGYLCR